MASNVFRNTPRLKLANLVSMGGASQLVADDFFEASGVVYAGVLRRWNGSTWVKATLRRWNGATWVDAVLRIWTGSAWGLIDTTGI